MAGEKVATAIIASEKVATAITARCGRAERISKVRVETVLSGVLATAMIVAKDGIAARKVLPKVSRDRRPPS
jgi:hypothetical protein